jgi:hypothetical protein
MGRAGVYTNVVVQRNTPPPAGLFQQRGGSYIFGLVVSKVKWRSSGGNSVQSLVSSRLEPAGGI